MFKPSPSLSVTPPQPVGVVKIDTSGNQGCIALGFIYYPNAIIYLTQQGPTGSFRPYRRQSHGQPAQQQDFPRRHEGPPMA
jgi:hypothetical protein